MSSNEGHGRGRTILPSSARYVMQLAFAYPATLIVASPLFFLFSEWKFETELGGGGYFVGFRFLACVLAAVLVGWVCGFHFPTLVSTGSWIWIPPVAFALADIIPARLQSPVAPGLFAYLYATGNNQGLAVTLLTLPIGSTIGYSLGTLLSKVERGRPQIRTGQLGAAALVTWIAALLAGVMLMKSTERHLVQRHKNLRVAVRLTGTPLWPEPGAACKSLPATPSTKAILIESLTPLESLGHLLCDGGRQPSGIDRVRVVDGGHKGYEGWVVTSEVWRPLP